MLMIARKRREAERLKRLEDVFREADIDSSGTITAQQMVKLFVENECADKIPNLETESKKLAGRDGLIRINEFLKFSMGTDLCKVEFHDRVFNKTDKEEEAKAKREALKKKPLEKAELKSPIESKMDKIEFAFRKFDTNNDGFLSRDEFDEMMKDHVNKEQADRIFRSCDQAQDGKISLDEFRRVLKKGEKNKN